MTINEIQDQIIEEFSVFEDWMDKYNYLIELGRECPIIEEKDKKDNNLIKGCQSRVWVSAEIIDGKMVIKGWLKRDTFPGKALVKIILGKK